jgi:eukaryotic-like serine/threonine-protein kinase
VAIKVLPAHLAASPERRQRFEREAKAISALTHPHICVLHDVGQHDGIDFLVMECLEGETLADRLKKGALPLDQVLRYGIEIAGALDMAHRHGIVHRDLKPGNVMLTKSGAKLLDFGLAKLRAPEAPVPSASELSALATGEKPLTAEGSIVGTFQYMAPEQLEGKEPDARADLFSLGAVLYEMATGLRAFKGKTQASLIGAILASEPLPISSLQPLTPLALDRMVAACLAKDPDERWQSAHDLLKELKWIQEGPLGVAMASPGSRWRLRRRAWEDSLSLAGATRPASRRARSKPRCPRRPRRHSTFATAAFRSFRPTAAGSRSSPKVWMGRTGSGSSLSMARPPRRYPERKARRIPSGRRTAGPWVSSPNAS